jgi:cytochrome c-type biogenesis protein CcmF
MAPLVLLIPFGPLTRWQQEQASRPLAMLAPWFALAVALGVIAWFTAPQGAAKTAAGVAGAAWVALGTLRFVWSRVRTQGGRLTAEMFGMTLGHLGVAVFVMGALLVEAQNVLRELPMVPGQTHEIGRYAFRFDGVEKVPGPNYMADRGTVQVFRDDKPLTLLHPEKRAYASGGQVMTDAGIHAGVTADIFVALGEPLGGDTWAVRLHVKPFVRWIWAGALLMALGGFVTATDRRFKLAPKEPT